MGLERICLRWMSHAVVSAPAFGQRLDTEDLPLQSRESSIIEQSKQAPFRATNEQIFPANHLLLQA